MTRLGGNWRTAPGPGDLTRSGDPQAVVPWPDCRRCGVDHKPGPCPVRDKRRAA